MKEVSRQCQKVVLICSNLVHLNVSILHVPPCEYLRCPSFAPSHYNLPANINIIAGTIHCY